ncbi:hypothetical protein FHR23_001124 [Stakelama sediminis]|uniref:Uncharacterized protein n=1 Tax=Stakelama sediminis TaxID=463200 RepID=A0A840YXD9_9SPHN|nr:hypothetical protein [Stakelama sediminis]MBB5718217.1 hypothetical protein [Stakelama sediminis]
MTDGRVFLAIGTLISIGVFANGLRFAHKTSNPWSGKHILGMSVKGSDVPLDRIRRIGRLQMIIAPIFFLFLCALCFGLLGPVQGIQTIQF